MMSEHEEGCPGSGFNPETGRYCCDTYAVGYVWGGQPA